MAPAAPATSVPAYGRPFWLAYTANLLAMVGISLLYRYADFVMLLGGSEFHLGWIVGVGMVGSLMMRLALGAGIDRYGTRLVWLGSLLLLAATCFAHLGVSRHDSAAIYLLRIVYCCGLAGIFGASMTFVSGRASAARIAEMVGMLGTSGFLGTVIGTQLGDLMLGTEEMRRSQIDGMFVVAGLLALGSMVFAALATRRQARPVLREHLPIVRLLWRYQPGPVLLVGVAMGVGLSLPTTFLRTYTAELSISRMGLFFGIYAPAAILTRLVTRRWPERFGPEPMILLGMVGVTLSLLLFLLVHHEWQLLVPGITYGMSHAILFPSVVAAGSSCFPSQHRGLGTTLMLATWDTGILIGAPAAGAILQYSEGFGLPPYPTMFVAMAGVMAAVGLFYAATWRRGRAHDVL